MSQDAGAGDASQSKRFPNSSPVYGQIVYQFPADGGGESESAKSGGEQKINFLAPVLIILLVVGGAILYSKGKSAETEQFNYSHGRSGQQLYGFEGESCLQRRILTRARVAVGSLYLREGPGTSYMATYLLPENWKVSLTGDFQSDECGEIWARVLVNTREGRQEGWVCRRFLWY